MTRNAPRPAPQRWVIDNSEASTATLGMSEPGAAVWDSMGPTIVGLRLRVQRWDDLQAERGRYEQMEFAVDAAGARTIAAQLIQAADRADGINGI